MVLFFVLSLVFYIALPLLGAFQVRVGWRKLRRWVHLAASAPLLDFPALQESPLRTTAYRMIGSLEAFEGRDTLWLGSETVSLPVLLRGVDVYFLEDPTEGDEPQDPPRKVGWTSLGVLPEGTHFLVWGHLAAGPSGPRFQSSPDRPLLVLVFSGDAETVLTRTLRDARQPIEHWNRLTPISLVVGFAALLLASYWELRDPAARSTGLLGLALALLPSTFFLPPGIFLFYWFSRLWARGRSWRAKRDLIEFRAGPSEASLDAGRRAKRLEIGAHAVLVVGALLNALLLATTLRWLVP